MWHLWQQATLHILKMMPTFRTFFQTCACGAASLSELKGFFWESESDLKKWNTSCKERWVCTSKDSKKFWSFTCGSYILRMCLGLPELLLGLLQHTDWNGFHKQASFLKIKMCTINDHYILNDLMSPAHLQILLQHAEVPCNPPHPPTHMCWSHNHQSLLQNGGGINLSSQQQ